MTPAINVGGDADDDARSLDRRIPHPYGGPACSTGSRLADEPVGATASLGRRWLLVEVAGAWGYSAFTESPVLDPAIGRSLVRRAEAAGLRIAAMRRPGRVRATGRWRWALVDTRPGRERIVRGEVGTPDELLSLPLDGSAGRPSEEVLAVVCAHGRHDECCAVRGLRATQAMARRYPEITWESSHLGGDRFAATAVLFPHGLSFARADDGDAADLVDEYLAGRIADRGFRGRTAFTTVEQAAQDAARRTTGDRRVDAFLPILVDETASGWTVVLAAAPDLLVVDVVRSTAGPLYSTCRSTQAGVVPRVAARP